MEGTDASHDFTKLSFFRRALRLQMFAAEIYSLFPSNPSHIFSLCFVTLTSSGRVLRSLVSPFIGLLNFSKTLTLLYTTN